MNTKSNRVSQTRFDIVKKFISYQTFTDLVNTHQLKDHLVVSQNQLQER